MGKLTLVSGKSADVVINGVPQEYSNQWPASGGYWMSIISRSSLDIVARGFSTGSEEPSAISNFLVGKTLSDYFLAVVGVGTNWSNIPSDGLHTFLTSNGAGPELAIAEQVISDAGYSLNLSFNYAMASQMGGTPGFEVHNFSAPMPAALALELKQFVSGGDYSLVEIGPE